MSNDGFTTIGITGKKQTGKTTFGNTVQDVVKAYNLATGSDIVVARYNFAKPLKEACHILFGGTEANWYGDFKTEHLPHWKGVVDPPTPRKIMQFVGTELFRHHLCEDFWLRVAEKYIMDMYEADPFDVLVVDDVRFDNEAEFLHNGYDATVVELKRTFTDADDTSTKHASEHGIDSRMVDYVYNCDDRSAYAGFVTDLLQRIKVIDP